MATTSSRLRGRESLFAMTHRINRAHRQFKKAVQHGRASDHDYRWSLQARSLSLQGWGLIDLPLRAAFSPAHPLARRDVPLARARAFQLSIPLPLGEWPRLPFTARIERPLSYRGGSASKKGTWPLLPHPSEAARCASTEDHQPPPPPLAS